MGAPSRSASSPRCVSRAIDTAVVEDLLHPSRCAVDRDRAWQALLRDEKGALKLVLLSGYDVDVPAEDVRRELDRLIA